MGCLNCAHWLLGTWSCYKNSEPEFKPESAETNKGKCQAEGSPIFGQLTPPEFSCSLFAEGKPEDQQLRKEFDQEKWEVWELGPCPNCRPPGVQGEAACHRCAGTGKVPYYHDGYVGEQQTWEHPIAKERRLARELEARRQSLMEELARLQ